MTESIGKRVSKIVIGSFHMLIDAVENAAPEATMEQAIREVEQVLADVRTELGKELANKHLLTKRLNETNRKHEELSEQLELALREEREDLAEAAVSKQLDLEAQVPVIEQSIHSCIEREKELESFALALQARKREMHEELRLYRESVAERKASCAPAGQSLSGVQASSAHSAENRVAQAESAFQRVLEKQTGLRTVTGGASADNAAKLQELEEVSRKNRIQERLAAAKASIRE